MGWGPRGGGWRGGMSLLVVVFEGWGWGNGGGGCGVRGSGGGCWEVGGRWEMVRTVCA